MEAATEAAEAKKAKKAKSKAAADVSESWLRFFLFRCCFFNSKAFHRFYLPLTISSSSVQIEELVGYSRIILFE